MKYEVTKEEVGKILRKMKVGLSFNEETVMVCVHLERMCEINQAILEMVYCGKLEPFYGKDGTIKMRKINSESELNSKK